MYPSHQAHNGRTDYVARSQPADALQSLFSPSVTPISTDRFQRNGGPSIGMSPYAFAANDHSAPAGTFVGSLTGEVTLFRAIANYWNLTSEQAGLLLGLDPGNGDLVDRLFRGTRTLQSRDSKDRVAVLFRIRRNLSALLRDSTSENHWLRSPDPALDGKTPLSLMLEGSILSLLDLEQYVATIAGR